MAVFLWALSNAVIVLIICFIVNLLSRYFIKLFKKISRLFIKLFKKKSSEIKEDKEGLNQ